jgi:hypothetical protein
METMIFHNTVWLRFSEMEVHRHLPMLYWQSQNPWIFTLMCIFKVQQGRYVSISKILTKMIFVCGWPFHSLISLWLIKHDPFLLAFLPA